MQKFFLAFFTVALMACDNGGKVKADIDTTVNDIKNSAVLDSAEAKGNRFADSLKSKTDAVLDSSKVKSSRVLNNVGNRLKKLSRKLDTTR